MDEHLFKLIHFELFPIVITYSAGNFVKLLNTFSNHPAAGKETQQAVYREIENLINEQFEGKIDKHFSMSLTVARKYKLPGNEEIQQMLDRAGNSKNKVSLKDILPHPRR